MGLLEEVLRRVGWASRNGPSVRDEILLESRVVRATQSGGSAYAPSSRRPRCLTLPPSPQDTGKKIKAVCVVHNETTTGVTSDIGGCRGAMDAAAHPALLLVDGVSSIGALDFRFDEWRVDVAVTGSQKAMSLPTGLAYVCASKKVRLSDCAQTSPSPSLPPTLHIRVDVVKICLHPIPPSRP